MSGSSGTDNHHKGKLADYFRIAVAAGIAFLAVAEIPDPVIGAVVGFGALSVAEVWGPS